MMSISFSFPTTVPHYLLCWLRLALCPVILPSFVCRSLMGVITRWFSRWSKYVSVLVLAPTAFLADWLTRPSRFWFSLLYDFGPHTLYDYSPRPLGFLVLFLLICLAFSVRLLTRIPPYVFLLFKLQPETYSIISPSISHYHQQQQKMGKAIRLVHLYFCTHGLLHQDISSVQRSKPKDSCRLVFFY